MTNLGNGGRVGDGGHDLVDQLHGDVAHHPGSLVLLVGEGLRGLALLAGCREKEKPGVITAADSSLGSCKFVFQRFNVSLCLPDKKGINLS